MFKRSNPLWNCEVTNENIVVHLFWCVFCIGGRNWMDGWKRWLENPYPYSSWLQMTTVTRWGRTELMLSLVEILWLKVFRESALRVTTDIRNPLLCSVRHLFRYSSNEEIFPNMSERCFTFFFLFFFWQEIKDFEHSGKVCECVSILVTLKKGRKIQIPKQKKNPTGLFACHSLSCSETSHPPIIRWFTIVLTYVSGKKKKKVIILLSMVLFSMCWIFCKGHWLVGWILGPLFCVCTVFFPN